MLRRVDAVTWLEVGAPLAVALLAVWLGYLYQRKVFDRDKRRDSYIEAYSTLTRMTELVSHQEAVEFQSWFSKQMLTTKRISSGPLLARIDSYFREMAWRGGLLGIEVDYSILDPKDPKVPNEKLGRLPQQIMGRLLFEEEQLRQRMQRAILMVSSGTRVGIFHHPTKTIDVISKEIRAWSYLEAVFFSLVDPDSPCRVDWSGVDGMLSSVKTAAFQEIGITDHMRLTDVWSRRGVPWPAEIPVAPKTFENPRGAEHG